MEEKNKKRKRENNMCSKTGELTPEDISLATKIVINALDEIYKRWVDKTTPETEEESITQAVMTNTHMTSVEYLKGMLLKNG